MKLSELRPCDKCGGKTAPAFYIVRISQALVLPSARQSLGLMTMFHGNLKLAEAMSPNPDAVMVFGDQDKGLMSELIICQVCYLAGEIDLVMLAERRNEAVAAAANQARFIDCGECGSEMGQNTIGEWVCLVCEGNRD